MIELSDEKVSYGLQVRQANGEWQTASAGRTREYADDVFRQYAAKGECCRIVDSLGTTISEHIPVEPEQPPDCGFEQPSAAPAVRERQRIDLSRTRFFVTAWPDQKWPIEVILFIEKVTQGLTLHANYRESLKVRDRTCARNTAIKQALESADHFQWFVFIDNDVRPGMKSLQFLELEADVICCEVPMRTDTAWTWPNSYHDSFWCTSRKVLETIQPPWFMQQYNQDGTQMIGCICKSFQKKVLAAGFSIAHGGWAEHDRDASWCG